MTQYHIDKILKCNKTYVIGKTNVNQFFNININKILYENQLIFCLHLSILFINVNIFVFLFFKGNNINLMVILMVNNKMLLLNNT